MGDKLNMLVIQIHTKSQNPSLLHLTNTLLESEPQEEMQLKRYETFPKLQHLSGPMWQIGQEHQNNTISAGQSVKPWPLSGKPCWAVHNRQLHVQTCLVDTQTGDKHLDNTRCNFA